MIRPFEETVYLEHPSIRSQLLADGPKSTGKQCAAAIPSRSGLVVSLWEGKSARKRRPPPQDTARLVQESFNAGSTGIGRPPGVKKSKPPPPSERLDDGQIPLRLSRSPSRETHAPLSNPRIGSAHRELLSPTTRTREARRRQAGTWQVGRCSRPR